MWKYLIFIIIGIIIFLLLNRYNTFSIGGKNIGENCGRDRAASTQELDNAECNEGVDTGCYSDLCECRESQCVLRTEEVLPPNSGGGAAGGVSGGVSGGGGVPFNSIQCNTPVNQINIQSINVSIIQSESWFIDFFSLFNMANTNVNDMETYIKNIFRAINIFFHPGNCDLGDLDDIIDYDTFISDFILINRDIDPRASYNIIEFDRRYNALLRLCARIVLNRRIDIIEGRESQLQRLDYREIPINKEDYTEERLRELVMERLLPGTNIDDATLVTNIQLLENDITMDNIINMDQLNNRILQIQLNHIPAFRFGAPITQESLLRGISPDTRGQLTLRQGEAGSEGSKCNTSDLITTAAAGGGAAGGDTSDIDPCHHFLWCSDNVCRPIPRLMDTRTGLILSITENSQEAFGESHIYIRLDNESGSAGPTHKCKYTIQDGSIISIYKFKCLKFLYYFYFLVLPILIYLYNFRVS